MKNKKDLLEAIEEFTEENDFKYYVMLCDKGLRMNADRGEFCSMITMVLQRLKNKGAIKDRDIDMICKLAKLDGDGLTKELLNVIKEMDINEKDKKEIEKIIDEILEEM